MEQRIQEKTVTRKNGGSTVITISPAVKHVSGIGLGDTVEIVAENGKLTVWNNSFGARYIDENEDKK